MTNNNGVKVVANKLVLDEVTFEHLTASEKKVLLDLWFEDVRIIVNSPDRAARRKAGVRLAKRYLEQAV